MILTVLPHMSTHEQLFFNYKQENEFLGIIRILKDDINFGTVRTLLPSMQSFFQYGIDIKFNKPLYYMPSIHNEYVEYQTKLEDYIKAVWLTKDFINNGSFKNPIGVHWNPNENKWDIHPGGSRQRVLYFFDKSNELTVLGFNTNSKPTKFIQKFDSVEQVKQFFKTKDITLMCIANYGSIIPHVHFDQINMINSIVKHIHYIQNFYKTTRILTNFDTACLNYKEEISKPVKTIKVTIDDPFCMDSIIRAFLLLPSFEKFNDYGITIERT